MLRPRLPLPCLTLVTDRRQCKLPLVEAVRLAIEGGVDVVQLREKDLPQRELVELARQLRDVTDGKALLIVNGDIGVALEVRADGVHLAESVSPETGREAVGTGLLVGRSVHSLEAALEAERSGADYLQVGTIFATASKPGVALSGPQLIAAIRARVSLPLLAIGGINASNVGDVIRAGADGVAVVSAILAANDPHAAASELRAALDRAWAERLALSGGRVGQ